MGWIKQIFWRAIGSMLLMAALSDCVHAQNITLVEEASSFSARATTWAYGVADEHTAQDNEPVSVQASSIYTTPIPSVIDSALSLAGQSWDNNRLSGGHQVVLDGTETYVNAFARDNGVAIIDAHFGTTSTTPSGSTTTLTYPTKVTVNGSWTWDIQSLYGIHSGGWQIWWTADPDLEGVLLGTVWATEGIVGVDRTYGLDENYLLSNESGSFSESIDIPNDLAEMGGYIRVVFDVSGGYEAFYDGGNADYEWSVDISVATITTVTEP